MSAAPPQSAPDDFALMRGGRFSELMRRMGLDSAEHPVWSIGTRFVLAALVASGPLVLLCWLEGSLGALLSERRVGAELLIALPVLLAGEPYVNGRVASAVRRPRLLGLLSPEELERFHAGLVRAARVRDRPWLEVVQVLLAYGMTLLQFKLGTEVPSFAIRGDTLTAAGAWYAFISYPLMGFALFRWASRFVIWGAVLVWLSRLELQIAATHGDKTGGLRFLATCQASFSVAVFALGSVVGAMTRGDLAPMTVDGLTSYARGQVLFGLAAVVVVNLPLLSFSRKLLEAKRRAGAKFSALMARHARDFERKWFGELAPGQTPLGAIEMSTQADLATAFSQSNKMRWFPYGFRPFLAVAASGLLLPLVPRLLADRQLLEALLRVMTKMF